MAVHSTHVLVFPAQPDNSSDPSNPVWTLPDGPHVMRQPPGPGCTADAVARAKQWNAKATGRGRKKKKDT
jgi:hypothetical protein